MKNIGSSMKNQLISVMETVIADYKDLIRFCNLQRFDTPETSSVIKIYNEFLLNLKKLFLETSTTNESTPGGPLSFTFEKFFPIMDAAYSTKTISIGWSVLNNLLSERNIASSLLVKNALDVQASKTLEIDWNIEFPYVLFSQSPFFHKQKETGGEDNLTTISQTDLTLNTLRKMGVNALRELLSHQTTYYYLIACLEETAHKEKDPILKSKIVAFAPGLMKSKLLMKPNDDQQPLPAAKPGTSRDYTKAFDVTTSLINKLELLQHKKMAQHHPVSILELTQYENELKLLNYFYKEISALGLAVTNLRDGSFNMFSAQTLQIFLNISLTLEDYSKKLVHSSDTLQLKKLNFLRRQEKINNQLQIIKQQKLSRLNVLKNYIAKVMMDSLTYNVKENTFIVKQKPGNNNGMVNQGYNQINSNGLGSSIYIQVILDVLCRINKECIQHPLDQLFSQEYHSSFRINDITRFMLAKVGYIHTLKTLLKYIMDKKLKFNFLGLLQLATDIDHLIRTLQKDVAPPFKNVFFKSVELDKFKSFVMALLFNAPNGTITNDLINTHRAKQFDTPPDFKKEEVQRYFNVFKYEEGQILSEASLA
jgi:hypothetical protein